MKLFINIVIKRIYVFYTVAWNCRTKKGFPVCKKENLAGLQAHRKRGKALVPVHHTLVKPAETWSALVNIRRKALESSVGFRKRMTSRSPRGIYLPVTHFASIVHSDLSDDLTVCFEVLSCFFDHPSIDSNKKMSLSPFKGCFEVSILFLLRGVN